MIEGLKDWLYNIVSEALKHREHPKDQTADIVRLMLDLHDKTWSIQSDAFLRRLNINPEAYWEKAHNGKRTT